MTYRIEKTVDASRNDIVSVLKDVDHYPEFIPWLKAAKTFDHDHNQFKGTLSFDMGLGSFSYTSLVQIKEVDPLTTTFHIQGIEGAFKGLTSLWVVTQQDETKSHVVFELDVTWDNFVLKALYQTFFEQYAQEMIHAFVHRVHKK